MPDSPSAALVAALRRDPPDADLSKHKRDRSAELDATMAEAEPVGGDKESAENVAARRLRGVRIRKGGK